MNALSARAEQLLTESAFIVRATTRARLHLHAAVVAWGFTSVLGRLITLRALALVWWRVLFAVASLSLAARVWRGARALPRAIVLAYAASGVVLALHWVAFFEAVKLADASVAATCLAVAPTLVALVEPLAGRRRFDPRELALGGAAAVGVALVVGGVPPGMRAGIVVGLVAAALEVVLLIANKRLVGLTDPLTATWLELGGAWLFLTALLPMGPRVGTALAVPGARDAMLLFVLAGVCTVVPTAAYLGALRHLSAFGVQLTINLEPVYSIVLAIVLLGEQRDLHAAFYGGVALLVGALFGHAWARTPRNE